MDRIRVNGNSKQGCVCYNNAQENGVFVFKAGKDTEKNRVDMTMCLVAVGREMAVGVQGSEGWWSERKTWGGECTSSREVVAVVKSEAPKHGWTLASGARVGEHGVSVECGGTTVCLVPINERMLKYEVSFGECTVCGEIKW